MQPVRAAIIILIICACTYALDVYTKRMAHASLIRDVGASTIEVIHPYESKNTHALRTARYSLVNHWSPLFSVAGTDPDLLAESVSALASTTEQLRRAYQSPEEQESITALHPLNFLAHLPDLERARRNLNAHAEDSTIERYHATLIETIDAYRSDLARYAAYMKKAEGSAGGTSFAFWGGITDYDTIIARTEILEREAEKRKRVAMLRYACWKGYTYECESATDAQHALVAVSRLHGLTIPDTEASTMVALRTESLLNRYYAAIEQPEERASPAIIVSVPASACYREESPTFYAAHRHIAGRDIPEVRYDILNDLFFYDAKGAPGAYLAPFEKHGVRFVHQMGGNPYLCLDAGFDYARAAATQYVTEQIARLPPLPPPAASSRHDVQQLAAQEASLANAGIVSSDEVEAYLRTWSSLVRTHDIRALSEAIGGSAVLSRNELLEVWNSGTPRFNETIGLLIGSNAWMAQEHAPSPDSFAATMLSRSYASFLFFPFNASVSSRVDSMYRERSAIPFKNFWMVRYREDLSDLYDTEEILDLMIRSKEIFKSSIESPLP